MTGKKTVIAILTPLLLLIVVAGYFWQTGSRSPKAVPPSGPLEKITLGALPIYTPGLLFIAQEKGYFKENNLEVALKFFPTGQVGMEQLQAGRIDIAYVSDFVFVDAILKGAKSLRCLGSIAAAEINHLLVMKEKGITAPRDLQGKRVGVARGTIAEFFLGRFLTFNNLALKDIKLIYLSPAEMSETLANDRADAVMVWTPVTYDIIKQLGGRVLSWPGQSGQNFYNVLVSTHEFTQNRSKTLEQLFKALAQAEKFIKNNQEESLAIIAQQINLDKAIFKDDWLKSVYELSLDQSLLIAMEDEARWMIRNKLTEQTRLPDFLDYLYAEPLAKVDPRAVRAIIPKSGSTVAPATSGAGKGR